MSLPGTTPVPSLLPDYMRSLTILSNGVNQNAQAVLNNIRIQPVTNSGGSGNIGIGINANKDTTAPSDHNIGIGTNALQIASTAGVDFNNALGYESMQDLTNGVNNNAIGSKTLTNMTTGSYNTAIGNETLTNMTTGSYNTAIGANASDNSTNLNNTIAIGPYTRLTNDKSGILKFSQTANSQYPNTNTFWFGDPNNGWINTGMGDVSCNNLDVSGTLTVYGQNTLKVIGKSILNDVSMNSLKVDGDISGINLYVTGNIYQNGSLVGNNLEDVDVSGYLYVTGDICGNNLHIAGDISCYRIYVTDNVYKNGLPITGTLAPWSDISANNLDVSGTLKVDGKSYLSDVSMNSLYVVNDISSNKLHTATLTATGDISGVDIYASGNIKATNLTVTSDISGFGSLNISGHSQLYDVSCNNLDVSGTLTVYGQNTLKVIGKSILNDVSMNSLKVVGDISGTGNLYVTGIIYQNNQIIGTSSDISANNIDVSGVLNLTKQTNKIKNIKTADLIDISNIVIDWTTDCTKLLLTEFTTYGDLDLKINNLPTQNNQTYDIEVFYDLSGQPRFIKNLYINNSLITTYWNTDQQIYLTAYKYVPGSSAYDKNYQNIKIIRINNNWYVNVLFNRIYNTSPYVSYTYNLPYP